MSWNPKGQACHLACRLPVLTRVSLSLPPLPYAAVVPRCVFILENVVPGKAEHLEQMNRLLGFSPLRLEASLVSGACRDRLYW